MGQEENMCVFGRFSTSPIRWHNSEAPNRTKSRYFFSKISKNVQNTFNGGGALIQSVVVATKQTLRPALWLIMERFLWAPPVFILPHFFAGNPHFWGSRSPTFVGPFWLEVHHFCAKFIEFLYRFGSKMHKCGDFSGNFPILGCTFSGEYPVL